MAEQAAPVRQERQPIPAPNAPGAMSEKDIAGALNSMFGAESAQPEDPVQPEPGGEEPPADPAEGEQPPAEQTEEPPPEEDGAITIDPEAPIFEVVTRKGEAATKVSLKELEAGYIRQDDYTRKTQELARARDQMSEEVRKAVEPTVQAYSQQLGLLEQAVVATIMPEFQNVNMEKLAEDDPSAYVKMQARFNKAQQLVGQIQAQQKHIAAQANAQAAERSRRALADPVTGIPDWSDELYTGMIRESSKTYGFTPDEVAAVVDHRMIRVLHDALEYRKAKAAQPALTKKVATAPKLVRPGAPTSRSDSKAVAEKEQMARLKKSSGRDQLEIAGALWEARRKRT